MKLKFAIVILTILAIIAIPLLFSHQLYSYFDLPKTIALYIFAAGLFLLYTISNRHTPNSGWLGKYISLYFIWLLFMALVSPNLSLAFFGGYSRYEGFFFFVASGFFFFIGNMLKEYKKQLILAVLVTGAVVGALAVWEFWDGFWSSFQRSSSTFGNPMILGTYFVLIIPACFGYLFTTGNRWGKLVGFLSLFLLVLGTIFSFSRGGWGGLLITAVLFGYFGGKQFWINRKTMIVTALICICAIGTGILMIRYQPKQVTLKNPQRLQSMVSQPTTDPAREAIYCATWQVFLEHPFTGVGLNGLATTITKHLSAAMVRSIPVNMNFDLAHNDLLHTMATQGIPGLLIYLGLLFWLAKT
ncbi:MAG TPA: O-antigen ligase family protein, partial [Bacillota bacterium]|nr:O-antigen ligase family protein [Bacillota bacterium]